MLEPAIPLDEEKRLAALHALNVLDTLPEERFDRLTRLARHMFGVPIALVSLVDSNRQWFKSCQGLDASETPRNISFCGHAILEDRIFVISDTLLDPRFADNPLVSDAPHIRFYAGAPLKLGDGQRVGTLCVIDTVPHQVDAAQLDALHDLAQCVCEELERSMQQQRAAETALFQARHASIIASSDDAIISKTLDGVITTWNLAAEKIFGYTEQEALGHPMVMLFPPDRLDEESQIVARIRRGEHVDHFETVRVRKNGERFYASINISPIFDEAGHISGASTILRDISEQKKSQRDFAEVSRLSEAVVNGADHLIITTDTQGVILSFNRAAEASLGYRAEELVGKLTPAVFHDLDEVVQQAKNLTESGLPVEPGFEVFVARSRTQARGDANEWTYVRKDGSRFPVLLTVSALRDQHGEIYAFLGIATDISERNRAAQAQRENETRLAAILDNVLDGIITINERGLIESFSKSAEKIFGYDAAETIGHNIKMLMPEPYHSEHDGYLHNFVQTGKKKIIGVGREVVGRCKNGTTFPMDLAVSEMLLGDKKMFTGIVRDITERVKIARMKNEFISTVSHELRTPLTSIRGSLGLIVGGVAGELPAQAKVFLEIAHKNSERLILLINDILDMEKIEAGKMEFHAQPVKLLPLLQQAVAGNNAYATPFQVSYELADGLPDVTIRVDENRMMQVLANLLSNAAKFSSPGGKVSIAAHCLGSLARITVTDHGIGIEEAFKDQLFQKFSQADASDTRKKGGTGLGLSITKAIVEMMGGSIGFDSEPNVQTTFYVEFPIVNETAKIEPDTAYVAGRHHVLICEDDPDIAALLRLMLVQIGLTSDIAYDAAQAKLLLKKHDYAAMTLDLGLPDQNGIALIRELRESPATASLPILVISANAEEGSQKLNGDVFKVVDWLSKPISPDKLKQALYQALRNGTGKLPKVLHIEDDQEIIQVVHSIVGEHAEMHAATTVTDALSMLEQHIYDLAILDLGLPDGSGISLLSVLNNATPPVPVLVFSASELEHEYVRKVDAVLLKSRVDNAQLLQTIQTLIGVNRHAESPK